MLHHMLRAAAQRAFNVLDPYFQYVTMLLHGDGTNGAQNNTFVDSSTNNFTITRNGNTTQGTFSPYGSNWSNYFDGSGDYLVVPDNTAFDLAASDWTFETWVNFSVVPASGGAATFASQWRSSSSISYSWFFYLYNNAGTYQLYLTYSTTGTNQSNLLVNLSTAPTVGSWNHVAFVRSGTNFLVFWNGVQVGSTQTLNATIFNSTTDVWIGAQNAGGSPDYQLNGYLSNLRLVKGTAVYTANFTPPTAPLTAITNTSLLTCADNRFIDDSTNNFTITKNGDVSVQRFSPFSPTSAYSTSVIGGSGYFDGSGDSLSVATTSALSFGTGDFTVEAWVYKTSAANTSIFDGRVNPGGAAPWAFYIDASNFPYFYDGSVYTSSVAVTLNAWTHIVAVRTSGVLKIFVNGVQGYSATLSTNLDRSAGVFIGVAANTSSPTAYYLGYLTDARVVKGTAVYTSAFTPPTAPLTAITNTSLLLSCTNAGILDNAMMNDLETVGNAQISTSVKKYGTGSMYFDGTGDGLVANGVASSGAYNRLTASGIVNTVEFWLYLNAFTSPRAFLCGSWASSVGWTYDVNPSGDIFITNDGAGPTVTLSSKITTGAWQHLAFVNDGTNIKIYLNGTNVGTQAVTSPSSYIGPLTIGLRSDAVAPLNGYIDDLRITKGVARYTTTFTPPTAAFPNN